MHGDGAQGGESRGFEIHLVRQRRQQVARHADVFGMHGVPAPGASHALTDLKTCQSLAQGDDRPGGGIAQRHRLVQAVESSFQGGQQTFAAGFIQHLAHQVGPRAGFAQQRFFGEFNQHALGAGGDQRDRIADQRLATLRSRDRDFRHSRSAVFHVLKELFHTLPIQE